MQKEKLTTAFQILIILGAAVLSFSILINNIRQELKPQLKEEKVEILYPGQEAKYYKVL